MERLVEVGYNALTVEDVARRAGVGVASIYRRWPSKARLVHEVVFPDDQRLVVSAGMSLEEFLRSLVTGVAKSLGRPEAVAAIPGLLAEYRDDPDLRRSLSERFEPETLADLGNLIDAAIRDGRVRSGVDVGTLLQIVLGTVLVTVVGSESAGGSEFVERLLRLLLDGIHVHPDPSPRDAPRGER